MNFDDAIKSYNLNLTKDYILEQILQSYKKRFVANIKDDIRILFGINNNSLEVVKIFGKFKNIDFIFGGQDLSFSSIHRNDFPPKNIEDFSNIVYYLTSFNQEKYSDFPIKEKLFDENDLIDKFSKNSNHTSITSTFSPEFKDFFKNEYVENGSIRKYVYNYDLNNFLEFYAPNAIFDKDEVNLICFININNKRFLVRNNGLVQNVNFDFSNEFTIEEFQKFFSEKNRVTVMPDVCTNKLFDYSWIEYQISKYFKKA